MRSSLEGLAAASGCSTIQHDRPAENVRRAIAADALQHASSREGNHRFVSGAGRADVLTSAAPPRREVAQPGTFRRHSRLSTPGSCRTHLRPGPWDLFVIRIAGNIVAPSQVGSVEFAVEKSVFLWLWSWVTHNAGLCRLHWRS
jgi:hypothetical protein